MCFLFRVRFHRRFWLVGMMALVLAAGEGRVVGQDVFAPSAPAEDAAARRKAPLWEERGLRAALADPSPELRSHAVEHITQRNWVTYFLSLKELRPMLQSPNPYTRNRALAALAQLGPEAAPCAGEILPLLKDEADWKRKLAVEALGQMGREVVPHAQDIVPLLQDEESSVREAAAQALGNLGRVDAATVVPLIQPLLADIVSPAERDAALTVTAPRSADPFGPAPAASPGYGSFLKKRYVRRCAVLALASMGAAGAPLAVPILQPLLKDGDEDIRNEAVRALEILKKAAPESVAKALETNAPVPPGPHSLERISTLISQLRAADEATRSPAAKELAAAGEGAPPQVISVLLPLLNDSQYFVVCSAAAALQQAGQEAAACRKALLPLLKSPDADARRLAVETLKEGEAGPEAAAVVLPALLPLIQDPERRVKYQAADVFHDWGAAAAPYVKDFLTLLNDSGDYVRVCAMHALAGGAGMQAADTVVPALIAVLPKCSIGEQSSVVHALEDMAKEHTPAATAALLHLLKDPDSSVRSLVVEAMDDLGRGTPTYLQDLLPLLTDPSSRVRLVAFTALREMGPEAASAMAPELLPLLQDTAGMVVLPPVKIMNAWGEMVEDDSATQLPLRIMEILRETDQYTQPAAFQAMLMLLRKSPDRRAKFDAGHILRVICARQPLYLKDVLPLLQDKDPEVLASALHALADTGPEEAPRVARALLPLLQTTQEEAKYDLIDILGKLGPAVAPVVVPALLPLIQDPDPTVRVRLAFAMRAMCPAAASYAADLRPLLQAPEGVVKSRALGTLGCMGAQAVPVLVQALPQLFAEPDVGKPEGLDMYELSLRLDVFNALEELGKTAAPQLAQALLPLLGHPDPWVHSGVMESLDSVGPFTQSLDWHCAALAAALGFSKDEDVQQLRYHLYLWSGHDDDLLLSVRWLGKPAAAPAPANGKGLDAAEQSAALSLFLKLWDASAPYPAVRREIAQRTADVAQSITAAPEEKVAALLTRLEFSLKADDVKETQPTSSAARSAVQSALARGR